MTLEVQEIEAVSPPGKDPAPEQYPTGGEVSALTLLQDVRAIRKRMDGVEVALRQLGARMEELSPASVEAGAATPQTDSLDALRAVLLSDVQNRIHKRDGRVNLFMSASLVAVLGGLGAVGWMVHRLG